jgi:outer membrane protein TolC
LHPFWNCMYADRIRISVLFLAVSCTVFGCKATSPLAPSLLQIEQRLEEEANTDPCEPNSSAYRRAIGEVPARVVPPREARVERTLTLDECLLLAFGNNNDVKVARQSILAAGGSKLIANSRFLPTIDLIYGYEHARNFGSANHVDVASTVFAQICQTIFEYGKDHPDDLALRAEQRSALFDYEDRVATTFSEIRKAFFFIKLKEQQIATRKQLLEQFERQYQVKQQRMKAGNLSVKIEVLTANLNVLEEKSRINTLKTQKLNRTMALLRLIGLPVRADRVGLEGEMDSFGIADFDMDWAVRLALSQSSEVALAEARVAERQRALDQLRYEYLPDLSLTAGYQDENGMFGTELVGQNETWGAKAVGRQKAPGSKEGRTQNLGLFGSDTSLDGPDPGWSAGAQVRIPIWEGGARKGWQIIARAELDQCRATLDDVRDRVELEVRQGYESVVEQRFQVELAQEKVNIENERFSIQAELRDLGKRTDDELETFRRSFFDTQDRYFDQQEEMIDRQENLRLAIRYFK